MCYLCSDYAKSALILAFSPGEMEPAVRAAEVKTANDTKDANLVCD